MLHGARLSSAALHHVTRRLNEVRFVPVPPHLRHYPLLHGPYAVPAARVGRTVTCMLRGKAKVCGWTEGRIPWPLLRVGHGGKGVMLVTSELARAVRLESAAAMRYWWGVCSTTVFKWCRALSVPQWNEGTRHLWSLWKEHKLPDQAVPFSPAAMRRQRLACGLTQHEVAKRMGWHSINSYGQMESGRRRRAVPQTLERLAAVLGCRVGELTMSKDFRRVVARRSTSVLTCKLLVRQGTVARCAPVTNLRAGFGRENRRDNKFSSIGGQRAYATPRFFCCANLITAAQHLTLPIEEV